MKLISEHVRDGVRDIDDLRDALQLAVQLEFATIPPYLCAQWSIRHDPDRVESVIHRVVNEEMSHMALAGNLLNAIGGTPRLAHPGFVPTYPTNTLPGGIDQILAVDLKPLSLYQLAVFMQIEHPDFPPVAFAPDDKPATIGEFYESIIEAFLQVSPPIDSGAYAIPVFDVPQIKTCPDAINVLRRIMSQGEGLADSPDQPTSPRNALAHYYAFKEIFKQKRLVEVGDGWGFDGAPVTLPDVYEFEASNQTPSPSTQFNSVFSNLLIDLEASWKVGDPLNVSAMFELKLIGTGLIRRGIRPEFRLQEPETGPALRLTP